MATKKKPGAGNSHNQAAARKARADARVRSERANRLAEASAKDRQRPAARVEDRLAALGGGRPVIDGELLEVRAAVAEQILVEDAERAEAASRRAVLNSLPAMSAIVKAASKAQAEADDAARLNEPAAFKADLYSTAKRASAKNGRDGGIRALVAYLEKRWTSDPNGCVSRGDLRKIHAHFERLYPRSAAAQVLREAGARSFSRVNLKDLGVSAHRVASIQDPFERRRAFNTELRTAGIQPNSPDGLRAAAYLEARIAQIMGDETVGDDLNDLMDAPDMSAPDMAVPDADIGAPPHAETEETYSEVDSPVTGEPLVIELAPGEGADAGVVDEPLTDFGAIEAFRLHAGMAPDQAAEELQLYLTSTGALYPKIQGVIRNLLQRMRSDRYDESRAPAMWRYVVDEAARMYASEFALGNARDVFSTAVRDRVAQELAATYEEQMRAGEYDYLLRAAQIDGPADMPSDTGGFAPAPDMPSDGADNGAVLSESSTVIEDPTAPGELLKVDVTPATGDEYMADGETADFAVFEDGADEPFDMISAASMREALGHLYERSGGENGPAHGTRVHAQVSTFDRLACVGDRVWLVRADVLAAEARRDQDLAARRQQAAEREAAAQADGGAPPVAEAAPVRTMSAADAARVAAALGFDEKRVAADVTRGHSVEFGPWSIGLGESGQVELRKANSKTPPRKYAFSRKSQAIREFMARVAGTADLQTSGSLAVTPVYRVTCAACKVDNDYPLAKAAAVACGSCKRSVAQVVVQAAMEAAEAKSAKRASAAGADAAPGRDYLLSVGFPVFASADAQALALNADRARSLVAEVVPTIDVIDPRPSDFKLLIRGASQAALNRVQAVLADRLGIVAQYAPAAVPAAAPAPGMAGRPMPPPGNAMAPSNIPPAPVTAPAAPAAPGGALQPTPSMQPGGAPMAPKPAAGGDAQSKAIEKVKDMGKISSARTEFTMADIFPGGETRTAQLAVDLEEMPALDSAPILEEGAALTPPSDSAGMDALLGPGAAGGDALAVATSVIDPEGEDAARSAMTHYRNQGMGIAQAIKEFMTEYKGFLEGFGDSSSPPRQMAEAALVRIAKEVYEKPVVLKPTASKVAADANPNNAGAVMGPDSGPAEPKALEPKVVPSFGTNVPVGSMSEGNTEGDIPAPSEKPGHPVAPKVPSLGDPEKVFKETLPVSGGDVTLKGASVTMSGRGWGSVLAEGAE